MPATGGGERRLAAVNGWRHGLSWSPDGRFLAVVDKPSEREPDAIYVLSVENGKKQRLTFPPAGYDGDCFPRFSPDGQSLAFVRVRNGTHADLYVFSPVHRTVTRVASEQSTNGGLDWTEDGGSIVFVSGKSAGLQHLWKVAATGGRPQRVDLEGGIDPSMSRRNRSLMVYVRYLLDWNIWRIPGPLANRSDTPPVRLIESTQLDFFPRFSPDGKRIAFISRRSGTTEVWTSDSDGTNQARLTFRDRDDVDDIETHVTWSADGQQLAFTALAGGNRDIYLIAAQGGFPGRMTTTPEDERFPSFSRDGRWIYFTSRKSGSEQIWKVSRAGGTPVQVTQHGGVEAYESPDGQFLYFTKRLNYLGEAGIWRMLLPAGEEEKVLEHGSALHWGVHDTGICYIGEGPHEAAAIECHDVVSGTVRKLASLEMAPYGRGFAVSPDGRWILVTRQDLHDSDLMMVENFK